jgi:hypothetical protein
MSRLRFRKPSPAIVLASIALFAALGGGAYAATSDTKSDKKIAKKAAKSYFNANIGGASVSHANTAGSATSATNATNATNAANATHAASADNAATVGGKQVKQFFASQPTSTSPTQLLSIDGITINGGCSGANNPQLTIANDSGQQGYLGGFQATNANAKISVNNFTSTPVDLTGLSNGGGFVTAELASGTVVSLQWADSGATVSGHCLLSGSVTAS